MSSRCGFLADVMAVPGEQLSQRSVRSEEADARFFLVSLLHFRCLPGGTAGAVNAHVENGERVCSFHSDCLQQRPLVIPRMSPFLFGKYQARGNVPLLLGVFTVAFLALGAWVWRARAEAARPPSMPLRQACAKVGVKYPPPSPRVVIEKAERRLVLYSGAIRLKEYRVVLGFGGDPARTKTRQGDRQTPTGEYYVCTRLDRSRFHRFLGLSYPAPADAEPALRERRISPAQRKAIVAAHRKRMQPPWGTSLGGAVGIHGGGAGWDWTAGCIALENGDIEELFAVLPLGAPVTLR